MTTLDIPELSLVVLVGISGSGKSTFAREHFLASQVLSSDAFRAMVSDDENDQSASPDAFEVLHYVAGKRLRAGRLTVVDATNVQPFARASLVKVAREHDVLPVAIVIDTPEAVCWERTQARPDRDFGRNVLKRQHSELRRSLNSLQREGFRKVHVVRDPSDVEIRYEKLFNDRKELTGPFDIIGDVHGCREELAALLAKLGWDLDSLPHPSHPDGRVAVFVGDLVDRGPDSPGVLRLVMSMVAAGTALCVSGNHEAKLLRHLNGRKVQITHGLAETIDQLSASPVSGLREFLDGLISHYVLDGGKLVVAHAGLKEEYHGRASGRVRAFALYGDTTGETDEYGLPVRYPWAREYRGKATVVYGHTPTPEAEWVNNTICLDTGAVFGGRLTALRYPERELVHVDALAEHYKPVRPLASTRTEAPGLVSPANAPGLLSPANAPGLLSPANAPGLLSPADAPGLLSLADVTGRRHLSTEFGTVTVPAEHSAAALEVMSRFAVEPRSLLWLPPTMAPCSTSALAGYLEHPADALRDLRDAGIDRVICEEKHMGSRAVVLVRKDGGGVIHTRTGRPFFTSMLPAVNEAIAKAGLWDELETGWLLLDAELLPWSSKALELIKSYAAVGAAGRAALPAALDVLAAASARGLDVSALTTRLSSSLADVHAYTKAYSNYVADPETPVTLAPFAILAAEGRHFADRDHGWHLAQADRLVEVDPALFTPTRRLELDLSSPTAVDEATSWWLGLTAAGGEGMVVKPFAGPLARDGRGRLAQPGIKCRGREYLRIIYGPSYMEPGRLAGLRERRLGRKRAMALREHGLGLSALANVASGGPLHRTHQLVFAILASESEPVDPRL